MSEKKEFIAKRKGIKYLDLFAGAGGFSGILIMDMVIMIGIIKSLLNIDFRREVCQYVH